MHDYVHEDAQSEGLGLWGTVSNVDYTLRNCTRIVITRAVVLTGSPGRVREGFDLIAQGRVRKLIISGVYPQAELLDIFPQLPYYGPINEGDVVLEKRSLTTYGNAQQTQPLVEALQCKDIILVTSRLHMYRSLKIFHSVFPADFEIKPRAVIASQVDPDFFELALEVTKSLFYRLWAY